MATVLIRSRTQTVRSFQAAPSACTTDDDSPDLSTTTALDSRIILGNVSASNGRPLGANG